MISKPRLVNKKIIIVSIVVSFILSMIITSISSSAHNMEEEQEIFYMAITIESADTLWDIAANYKDGFASTTKEMVAIIQHINNIKTEKIYIGDTLVIPYRK